MQKTPEIRINYSLEFEQLRVRNTFEKIAWFRDHGYNPIFPGNKKISEIDITQEINGLIELIEVEYDAQFYIDTAHKLKRQWQWFVGSWAESPLADTTLMFENTYEVFLTSYGVSGSYDIPNTVVINVRRQAHDRLANILFHEIVHLCLEPSIQKYSIPHWYKERLVDLFYKRFFPEAAFEQNLPKEVLVVDKIFEENFSDHVAMIQKLSQTLKLV